MRMTECLVGGLMEIITEFYVRFFSPVNPDLQIFVMSLDCCIVCSNEHLNVVLIDVVRSHLKSPLNILHMLGNHRLWFFAVRVSSAWCLFFLASNFGVCSLGM